MATKYNLPLSKVEEIIDYQFKFTARIIRKGDFEAVRLPYLGRFSAKKGRIKHVQDGAANRKR